MVLVPAQLTSPNFVHRPSPSLRRTPLVRLSRLRARASLCSFLGPAHLLLSAAKIVGTVLGTRSREENHRLSAGIALSLLLLIFFSISSPIEAKVRVAYSSIAGTYMGLFVAQDAGYYAQQDLDVEIVYIASGTTMTQALIGGDVQMGYGGAVGAIRAKLLGADLVIVGVSVDRMSYSVFSKKEIRTPADLKGRKLGVTRFGGSPDVWARIFLPRLGIIPEKDVALLQLGGMPQIVAGLAGGGIDAGILSPPMLFAAADLGFNEIIRFQNSSIPYIQNSFITTGAYAAKREDEVERLLRAYVVGVHRAKTDPVFTKRILGKHLKVQDTKLLDRTYDLAIGEIQRGLSFSEEAANGTIADIAKTNPKIRNLPRESFLNPVFVKRLEASGLVEKLYGKN